MDGAVDSTEKGEGPNMKASELDGLVLSIEFTLISIIQGVALFFLVDNARSILLERQWAYWPYAATGLLIILIFWSRAILHTLTVIRWPLEFGHNFIYVLLALIESVAFTQLAHPENWYAVNTVYAAVVWILFVFDLRIIRRRRDEGSRKRGAELFERLESDQFRNIRFLVPSNILFNAAAWAAVAFRPDIFLVQGWHQAIALAQLFFSLIYMGDSLNFYRRVSPLVTESRETKG
jgi:hypothetical protein